MIRTGTSKSSTISRSITTGKGTSSSEKPSKTTTISKSRSSTSETKSKTTSSSSSGTRGITTNPTFTSDTVTGTITSAPSGFSALTLSGTKSYTENDRVTTTGSDSCSTLLPLVIVRGGRGVVFWNLPQIPHVEFSLPGLPKIHLPCIRIFGASIGFKGTKTTSATKTSHSATTTKTSSSSSRSSSSSSASCTVTKTASDCLIVSVKLLVSRALQHVHQQSLAARSKGLQPQQGEHNVTSVCTATACIGGCIPGPTQGKNVPSYTTPEPVTTDLDLRRHNIAGRVPLDKRGVTSDILSLGGCTMAKSLTQPAWPAITKDIMGPDGKGKLVASYKSISRYDRATNIGCVFTTTRLDVAAFTNAPAFTDYSGKVYKNNNDGSLDHAYEKAWLEQFFDTTFKNQIDAGKISCSEINQIFFPPGCTKLLQPIFDGLASNDSLDFIIMSQYINGWKSIFFPEPGAKFYQEYLTSDWLIPATGGDAGWKWPSGHTSTQFSAKDALVVMLGYFEKVLYGSLEMKAANILNAHDKIIKQDNIAPYKSAFPGTDGIASAYKDFMTKTILPQINAPPKYLTNLWKNRIMPDIANAKKLKDVGTDLANTKNPGKHLPEWTKINNLITAHESHYNPGGTYSWDYKFAFTWNAIRKRSDGLDERQDCSVEVTPTPTLKRTSSRTSTSKLSGTSKPRSSTQITPTLDTSISRSTSSANSQTLSSAITSSPSASTSLLSSSIPISSSSSKSLSSSTSSSARALPSECPLCCECFDDSNGGCNCLCS
ncbi:21725305-b7ef-4914-aa7c-2f61d60e08b6 [Sclerotinia trifoliorum]|uniref:21725305-b7ef-4914-aa7c-2f61d60e08b6 n=1 Tax=Sclerotinia trifoliorum TaxID=28548 RepID=A0A8H2ZSC0_9HELO|nr:21725305-b7ef-4914-aa7c-2f61d60e08b6 [Sclerotinia trifoliorum]